MTNIDKYLIIMHGIPAVGKSEFASEMKSLCKCRNFVFNIYNAGEKRRQMTDIRTSEQFESSQEKLDEISMLTLKDALNIHKT